MEEACRKKHMEKTYRLCEEGGCTMEEYLVNECVEWEEACGIKLKEWKK